MSDKRKLQQPDRAAKEHDDVLALLLKSAGARQAPPPEDYERVLDAATAAWRVRLRKRQRRFAVALAAGVAAVAATLISLLPSPQPVMPAATVAVTDIIIGTTMIMPAGAPAWSWLDNEHPAELAPGTRMRTGPGASAGLLLPDNTSLRIRELTEVEFSGDGRVLLSGGTVYFDSRRPDRSADDERQIVIKTPDSTVRHLGTQFEVSYQGTGSRVRVREGRVLVTTRLQEIDLAAGEELSITDDDRAQRGRIAADHHDWEWVQAVAPAVYADDQPLSELLAWVARETGRQIYFARPELEDRASQTILHGSRQRLMPMEALAVMLETTDFSYMVTSGSEILIDAGSP
ncbi:MAG: FecR family protein [Gammaproteobacteria bacterium]